MPSSLPGRQPITTQSIVALALHLRHPLALAGHVGGVELLRHHALDAAQPLLGLRRRRALSGVSSRPAVLGDRLQPRAPLRQRRLQQRLVALGQQVEDDVAGRDLLREQLDPRLGRVDPFLQRVEFEVAVGVADHQLAVEHPAPRREAQLREVAGQVFAAARLDVDVRRRRRRRSRGSRRASARTPTPRPRGSCFAGQRQLRLDRWREREASRRPAAQLCRRARALARVRDRHRREQLLRVGVGRAARRPGRRCPARRSCRRA